MILCTHIYLLITVDLLIVSLCTSACPYTLNAYNCGHSFCALCLSRWFFSSLHTCGTWHESVSCPLCRAQATTPTHDSSRSRSLCPFIPNRPLDDVVKGLVEKLEGIALKVTVEDAGNETEYTESPRDTKTTLVAELVDWSEDGQKRKDWKVNEAYVISVVACSCPSPIRYPCSQTRPCGIAAYRQ